MADIRQKAATPQTLQSSGSNITNTSAGTAGTDLDNTSLQAPVCDFELACGFGSSVSAGEDIDLYLVPKLDGTNAAAADTSAPLFQPSHFAGTFVTPTTGTGSRRMTVEGVAVGPYLYTAYLHNKSGQTVNSWTLKAFPIQYQVG